LLTFAKSSTFSAIFCPVLYVGNSTFRSVAVGLNQTGECDVGYVGSPVLTCLENGPSTGNWSSYNPTSLCQQLVCPVTSTATESYPQTGVTETANGVCLPGFQGSPTCKCFESVDGSGDVAMWGTVSNPCTGEHRVFFFFLVFSNVFPWLFQPSIIAFPVYARTAVSVPTLLMDTIAHVPLGTRGANVSSVNRGIP